MFELLNKLLLELADEIDITESQEGAIKHAYNSVADWLNKPDSMIAKHNVRIFPQGSMMYGTAVKPINEDDYDIDLVCEFTTLTNNLSAEYVKKQVGTRIKENEMYKKMLDKEEGRRCWTLHYSDNLNFHMDILPAIPFSKDYFADNSLKEYYNKINVKRELALLATDKNKKTSKYKFIPTNPFGFAEWFKEKMQLNSKKILLNSIERVPTYPKKTVLQKSIQLLKRCRDVYFADKDNSLKPISMIITTLLAKCYNGENDIYSFIRNALDNMTSYIEKGAMGEYIIKNPVMENENFADKWKEVPQKATAFFEWLKNTKLDFEELSKINTYTDYDHKFKLMFSQKPVDRLMKKYEKILEKEKEVAATIDEELPSELLALEHIPYRKSAPWKLPRGFKVSILGNVSYDGGNSFQQFRSGDILPKNLNLQFFPSHDIKPPYKVKWQITNTGTEAKLSHCLRGDKFETGEIEKFGILVGKSEYTCYSGIHYIQCFILKNGNECVGVSKPFIVHVQ